MKFDESTSLLYLDRLTDFFPNTQPLYLLGKIIYINKLRIFNTCLFKVGSKVILNDTKG